MSDYGDLEDDIPDQPEVRQDALFGDDDDDEEDYQPNQDAQEYVDDEYDEPQAPEPQAAPAPAADDGKPIDIKARLAALAAKKREEMADQAAGKGKKRRDKEDGKDGKKRKRDKDGHKSSRPRRGEGGEEGEPKRRSQEDGPQVSVDSQDFRETDADRDFVEDDEVEGERVGSDVGDDEDGNVEPPPEAVEAEDMLFGKKRKKSRQTDAQMSLVVDDKIAKMEAAADMDMEAKGESKPAVHKLRLVAEAEEFLAQRKYHEMFIAAGGLGVVKAWLEPYADGTLPNVRVRSAMLNACKALPIDTTREDIKDNLKKSQLGSRIMFLAKCPDETQANKRTALELVQKWSRPIFFDADAEAEKRRLREEQLRRARIQSQELQRVVEEEETAKLEAQKKIRHGERGYRWHAMIPQTSKLDYIVAPERDATLAAAAAAQAQGTGKKDQGRIVKKMRDVLRKQKGSNSRAAVPSVEGRSIVF